MISVIIPAYDEETVIRRCLSMLIDGAEADELEILLVANGCQDRTAEIAREIGSPVRVIETNVASKVHALNLGDGAASSFPRFYIDADVVLPLVELRKLADVLRRGEALAVAPRFQMELTDCNWFVRAFYDMNDRMPSSREGIGGSGVYGMSELGRRRFDRFPEITADDGFIRLQFQPHERRTVEQCRSTVFAPRTVRDLVRIKTRSHFGTYELQQRFPDLWKNRGQGNSKALLRIAKNPLAWPKLAVYVTVKALAKRRARRRLLAAVPGKWERDATSRGSIGSTFGAKAVP